MFSFPLYFASELPILQPAGIFTLTRLSVALALSRERVKEILAAHEPTPLTPEQDKAIDEILEEARSFYREKGLMHT
ncbi:hypothetical protein ACFLWD_01995 [Chloroflexota bacterium]